MSIDDWRDCLMLASTNWLGCVVVGPRQYLFSFRAMINGWWWSRKEMINKRNACAMWVVPLPPFLSPALFLYLLGFFGIFCLFWCVNSYAPHFLQTILCPYKYHKYLSYDNVSYSCITTLYYYKIHIAKDGVKILIPRGA